MLMRTRRASTVVPSRRHVLALLGGTLAGCTTPALSVPRIEDQPCPPVEVHASRSVCSHAEPHDGLQITAEPTAVSTDPESLGTVSVEIENRTGTPVEYDPYRWRVYRNAGWGWTEREEPSNPRSDADTIPPGGSAGWSGIDALWKIGATGPTPAGLYAAVTTVAVGEKLVACVALVRVVRE